MIDQLGARARAETSRCGSIPGFGHGHQPKDEHRGKQSKHGIWYGQLASAWIEQNAIVWPSPACTCICGIRHRISNISRKCAVPLNRRPLSRADGDVAERRRRAAHGLPAHRLLRGPGRLLRLFASARRKRIEDRFGHPLRLEIEPGRYLVAESGYLVAEIRAVKRARPTTRSTCWTQALTISPGRSSTARITPCRSCRPTATRGAGSRALIVGGPLCESGDIFTQEEGGFCLGPVGCPVAMWAICW